MSRSGRPRSEKQTSCPSGRAELGRAKSEECEPARVRLQPLGQALPGAALRGEGAGEVGEERRRPAVGGRLVADPGVGVAGADGAVEHGQLLAGEAAEQQLDRARRGRARAPRARSPARRRGGRAG